jgi:hypothetical protein
MMIQIREISTMRAEMDKIGDDDSGAASGAASGEASQW